MDNDNNVIIMEAEDMGLEKQINNALQRENVTDKVISALKEKYGGMQLRSVDDKETYLQIKEARKEVRKVGILAEKICKKGREDAIRTQKLWLSKENEVLQKIGEVQDNLDTEIIKFDNEVERKANELRQQKENEYMQRQSILFKYGATFFDGNFILNHLSYDLSSVRESDKQIWEDIILPKYKSEWERVEAVRVAEENKRQQEIAQMKIEQENLARHRHELEEAKKEIQLQKEQQERIQKEQQQKQENELREIMQARIRSRGNQLSALGMTFRFNYDAYDFEDVNVDNVELTTMSDTKWDALIKSITPVIEQRKKEAEEKKQAQIAQDIQLAKESAARKERERIEEQQRQEAIKKEQEEERKRVELEQADDKTKWDYLVIQVSAIDIPEMKSRLYKQKVQQVKEKIEEISEL